MTEENGTTRPTLLLGLSLADLGKISVQALLVIALVVLWFSLQAQQASYQALALSCSNAAVVVPLPAPAEAVPPATTDP